MLLRWATTLGKPYYVWTSNIDGMFEKVGFSPEKVVTCHGDLHHLQCTKDRRKCLSSATKHCVDIALPVVSSDAPEV